MQDILQSKYTPIEKVKELKDLLANKDGLTKENLGLENENRPYLYRVRDLDTKITRQKFNEFLADCYRKNFLQTNEFHNLKIKNNLNKEIELNELNDFDEVWEKMITTSEKKNERDFYISKKILEEKFDDKYCIYYKSNISRSLNIHLKKDLDDKSAEAIGIISDCIGRQYQVDGTRFESRIQFVNFFHNARAAFKILKEKEIKVYGGTRNFILPFDYQFTDYRNSKNNFLNVLVCYRNFNFLNFGLKDKNIVAIDESIENDKDIYDVAFKRIKDFLKNSQII